MGDENDRVERLAPGLDGLQVLIPQLQKPVLQPLPSRLVKGPEGLIQKHDLRLHDQGLGHGHALALPARELGRVFVQFLVQLELAQ